MQRDHLKAKK